MELGFVDDDGEACLEPLATCWGRPFESGAAVVRRFSSYKGQSNFPGLWWSATTGDHVGFESWLERDHVMMLEAQPFKGSGQGGEPEAPGTDLSLACQVRQLQRKDDRGTDPAIQ